MDTYVPYLFLFVNHDDRAYLRALLDPDVAMTQRRPSANRRRAARRDVIATLALAGAIFVSILALPIGRLHENACVAVSHVAGRPVPCGLSQLSITLDSDRPFVSISFTQLPIRL
jgi:hypothetical protein